MCCARFIRAWFLWVKKLNHVWRCFEMFGMHGAIMYHPHFSGGKTECGWVGMASWKRSRNARDKELYSSICSNLQLLRTEDNLCFRGRSLIWSRFEACASTVLFQHAHVATCYQICIQHIACDQLVIHPCRHCHRRVWHFVGWSWQKLPARGFPQSLQGISMREGAYSSVLRLQVWRS